MHEFDDLAKKLWCGDQKAIRLVDALTDMERMHVEERIQSLYGVSVNLFGYAAEIERALEAAKFQLSGNL
jgi:hypothetical protein